MPPPPPLENRANRSIKDFFSNRSNSTASSKLVVRPLSISDEQPMQSSACNTPNKSAHHHQRHYIPDSDEDSPPPDLDRVLFQNRSIISPKPLTIAVKPSIVKPSSKRKFEELLQEGKRVQETRKRIEGLEKALREDEASSHISAGPEIQSPEKILRSFYSKQGEEGLRKAENVLAAMQRTEALNYHHVFHFFEAENEFESSDFPESCLDDELFSILEDEDHRESAFLSGLMSNIALVQPLPQELVVWILDQICFELAEDLTLAYLAVIRSLTVKFPHPLNNQDLLENLLYRLGARDVAVQATEIVSEQASFASSQTRSISPNLRYFLELIAQTAQSLAPKAAIYLLHRLLILSVDHTVSHDIFLSDLLSRVNAALILSLPETSAEPHLNCAIQNIYDAIHDPVLFSVIVHNLPFRQVSTGNNSSPMSSRISVFRQRLALSFALRNPTRVRHPSTLNDVRLNAFVIHGLETLPEYRINPLECDFNALAARFRILDIAIGNGFILLPTDADTDKIREHDEWIDRLAAVFKRIMSGIQTGGMKYVSRSNARDTANRIALRLLDGARRRKKGPRDFYKESLTNNTKLIQGWLKKGNDLIDYDGEDDEQREETVKDEADLAMVEETNSQSASSDVMEDQLSEKATTLQEYNETDDDDNDNDDVGGK